jgi:nucleoside-diphosphate-sugar epimerase
MTYLITGATGDVGSRVVERLLQRGDRQRVFVCEEKRAQTESCFRPSSQPIDVARKIS